MMMEHPSDKTIEMLFLAPGTLSPEEVRRLEEHFALCALCREHRDRIQAFYRDLSEDAGEMPSERDRKFAFTILSSESSAREERLRQLPDRFLTPEKGTGDLLEVYAETIEPYRRSGFGRIVHFAQMHPARVFAGSSMAALFVVLAILFLRPASVDRNPTYAKISNYKLYVYNKDADVLWTKPAIGFPDITHEQILGLPVEEKRMLALWDMDGDGTNEVLLSGAAVSGPYPRDSLFCFNGNGELRWRVGIGPMMSFGIQKPTSLGVIFDFVTLRKTPSAKVQLFVLAHDIVLSPTKLFELDPVTGKELHSYYNRGQSQTLYHMDVKKDGNEELLLGGVNDGYNRAYLAVLDPSEIDGYGPVPAQHVPRTGRKATEMYYILFPRASIAEKYGLTSYDNLVQMMMSSQGKLQAVVSEPLRPEFSDLTATIQVIYTFSPSMEIEDIAPGDGFLRMHDWLLKTGKIKGKTLQESLGELKDQALYWDGEEFVHSPTENRHYIKPLPNP